MYTANWQRHQFSPDGPELLDLWFKNELQYETRQPGFSPWNRLLGFDMMKKIRATSALLFLFAFFFHPSLLSLFIKPSISYGVRHVSHLFFEVGLWCGNISLNWYCELTGWALNHRWWWSEVKRSIRLSTFTSPRPCIEIITPLCLSFSWWTVPIYHLDYLWTLITSSNNESEIHR